MFVCSVAVILNPVSITRVLVLKNGINLFLDEGSSIKRLCLFVKINGFFKELHVDEVKIFLIIFIVFSLVANLELVVLDGSLLVEEGKQFRKEFQEEREIRTFILTLVKSFIEGLEELFTSNEGSSFLGDFNSIVLEDLVAIVDGLDQNFTVSDGIALILE